MDRPRIRKNDPVGMRARVLDAAARLFQQSGYAGTSVHDIVREAGVTAGALHHHFPAKRDIGLAVLAERVSPQVGSTWIDAVERSSKAIDGVAGVFDDVAAALEAQGHVNGCPLGNLALELALYDGFRSAVEGEYRRWRDAIADRLRREEAPVDPDAFADMAVALFTGAMTIAKTEQSPAILRSCAGQLRGMAEPFGAR